MRILQAVLAALHGNDEKHGPSRCRAIVRALTVLSGLLGANGAWADSLPKGDVFDQFNRYVATWESGSQALPGESVDPFTGTLRIQQEDVSLPGAAGLDLKLVRTYSSKIWGRADQLEMEPLLAEKEQSPLGYGWSMHLGRMRNPYGSGATELCSSDLPMFESPDGATHVFYPTVPGANQVLTSKDYWEMERPCKALESWGICVWSPDGTRYDMGSTQYFEGVQLVFPTVAIKEPAGNRIQVTYSYSSEDTPLKRLELTSIEDTYGRQIQLEYSPGLDGDRLTKIEVPSRLGVKEYTYSYTPYETIVGTRRFLTSVTTPAGTSYQYTYGIGNSVAQNRYALTVVKYPLGGTATYSYDSVNFFTGNDTVPFSVVTKRVVAGAGVASPGTWTYGYKSPAPGQAPATDPPPRNLHVTTITRPDKAHDTYRYYGFGWLVDQAKFGFTYAIGLPYEIARGDRQEIDLFGWDPRLDNPVGPGSIFAAPVYSSNCGMYLSDGNVYAPAMKTHVVARDNPSFTYGVTTDRFFVSTYSDFDDYGQPQTIREEGHNVGYLAEGEVLPSSTRTTSKTYFHMERAAPGDATAPIVHIVQNRPLSQTVCLDGTTDCVSSSWTYDGPAYQRDTETISGVTTRFGYFELASGLETAGNLKTVTDALGIKVELAGYRAGFGIPKSIDYNGVFSIARTVSPEGWILSQTDGRGNTTSYDYDLVGRLTSITPPISVWPEGRSLVTTYSYAPSGCWSSQAGCVNRLDRGSYFLETMVDGLGREVATRDWAGARTTTAYDAMGQVHFKSYPYGVGDQVSGDLTTYDALGRQSTLSRSVGPNGETRGIFTRNEFTPLANCLGAIMYRSSVANDSVLLRQCQRWYGRANEGVLWQSILGDGTNWWYAHNAAEQLTAVRGPLTAGDRDYSYDSHKFLASDSSGETGRTSYARNEIGQITARTDARGVVSTYGYDAIARLTSTVYGAGSANDLSQSYDKANNITHVQTANGGSYDYEYDEVDRVRKQTWTTPTNWTQPGAKKFASTYEYDEAGCPVSANYPSGLRVTATCDSSDRITSLAVNGSPLVSGISYNAAGQIRSMTYSNMTAVAHTFEYDARNRLKSLRVPGVVDLVNGYNSLDNLVSLCRDDGDASCLAATPPAMKVRTIAYDDASRLLTAIAPGQWGTLVYDYDWLGNRTFKSGNFDGRSDLSTTFVYDAKNRLEHAEGPEVFRTMTLTWDEAGHLAGSSDGATYAYDGHGRRVLKQSGGDKRIYHYDPAGRLIAETQPDGTKLRDYIYLGNRLLAVDGCVGDDSPPCTERGWYHTDGLGSVLARTDSTGAVVARLDYQPWGEQWSVAGSQGDRQYNGRVFDPGTGFHDYGARLYWPQIGRFISADSVTGNPASPMTLNRYSYVLNNPYKYVDPTGNYSVMPSIWGPEGGPLQWGAGWLATKMAAVSLDESHNIAVRAGAAVLGAAASLFDAETTEKTGAVMGMAGSIKMVGGKVPPELTLLNKKLASEAQVAELTSGGGEPIAGAGTKVTLRAAGRLAAEHGGKPEDWAKVRSSNYKAEDGTSFETHANRNTKTGEVKELKTKFQ
jgi:RHS repeat-associated protein